MTVSERRTVGVGRFVMHGPDGIDYENKIVYTEIVEPERSRPEESVRRGWRK